MLPAGADLQYESSVSSFEDELLENIRPNLISLTLSGSISSHFDSDKTSFHGDLLLSNNKELNNSLDSFTVILNPCKNDEVEVASVKSCPNNSQNSSKGINIIKASSRNTVIDQKSSLPEDCPFIKSKPWTSLNDINVKGPSVSGPSHSTTTVLSVSKSKDSGLTKTPSHLSLLGTSKLFNDSHIKDKYNDSLNQKANERAMSNSVGNHEESDLVDVLQKELQLKDNIIEQIQQNYLDLLQKYAEAENKIDKLRIKVIHPSSEDVPPRNSMKQLEQTSKYLPESASQIKSEDTCHSCRKCGNSQFPHISHGRITASTPVLNKCASNSKEMENVSDIAESSILKVKRWQQSLPSFHQEMHCYEGASKLIDGGVGKNMAEDFDSFSNKYYSKKNKHNPNSCSDFLGENEKKITASDLFQNCHRNRVCGITNYCRKKHRRKMCSEKFAKKSVSHLECLQIEPCSCWHGDSELLNNSDQNENPTSSCLVPPLELSTSSCSSSPQSSQEFKYPKKFASFSDASNLITSQKTATIKGPYTVNDSKYKELHPNSDDTSTSYRSLRIDKPIERMANDTFQEMLSPTVKRALLNFLLRDAFCSHAGKQVETHSCGINTDSPAHDIGSTESEILWNMNSVDLRKCLYEAEKFANLLKMQSENIVREVTKNMQSKLP